MKRSLPLFFVLLFWTFLHSYSRPEPEWLSRETLNRLSLHSLNRYYHNSYSQCGEDGIIEEICRRLDITSGFFVEFGAADGLWLSNTRHLWEKGWSGVMIEPDPKRFELLQNQYKGDGRMSCLNLFVTFSEDDARGPTLDQIAMAYFPDREIDFLSIDVDGADYLILENLKVFPKVICIESGLHWHPLFLQRIPDEVAIQNYQQPLSVVIEIAQKKGYSPVCLTGNLFLIRNDLYAPFEEVSSDALTIWRDGWRSTYCRDYLIRLRTTDQVIRRFEAKEPSLSLHPIGEDF